MCGRTLCGVSLHLRCRYSDHTVCGFQPLIRWLKPHTVARARWRTTAAAGSTPGLAALNAEQRSRRAHAAAPNGTREAADPSATRTRPPSAARRTPPSGGRRYEGLLDA